jgi:hypothetical protein
MNEILEQAKALAEENKRLKEEAEQGKEERKNLEQLYQQARAEVSSPLLCRVAGFKLN